MKILGIIIMVIGGLWMGYGLYTTGLYEYQQYDVMGDIWRALKNFSVSGSIGMLPGFYVLTLGSWISKKGK